MQTADYCCIPLFRRDGTLAGHTLVDAADRARIASSRWRLATSGYVAGTGRGRLLHRELLGLVYGDGLEADHINRDRLDNRRANLRIATRAQNAQNQGAHRDSTSRFRGVCWSKRHGRWRAQIGLNGRYYRLGYFDDEMDAAIAVDEFLREHAPHVTRDLAA